MVVKVEVGTILLRLAAGESFLVAVRMPELLGRSVR
jgi:hypothetical protein